MAADKAGREGSDFRLRGSVTLPVLYPLLTRIWRAVRRSPGALFRIDCSRVTDFSSQALAELVTLRRDVRGHGGDLMLTRVGPQLWAGLGDSLFESLVEGGRPMKPDKTSLSGPHQPNLSKWKHHKAHANKPRAPYFLRLRGARYQRFWLN